MNSAVLGKVTADAWRYFQTRFLRDKYGLSLSLLLLAALATDRNDDPQADAT